MDDLLLTEELLLLALDDEKGKIIFSSSTALPFGLAGAVLLDLSNQGKIDLNSPHVKVIDPSVTNQPILDHCLALLKASSKQRKIKYWITKLTARKMGLKNQLIEGLVAKGILAESDYKILWLFPTKRYPTLNPDPENQVRLIIKNIVLNGVSCDTQNKSLISLIHACDLIREIFQKDQHRIAKKNIKNIIKNEKIGNAVTDKMNEIVMVAVMAGVVAATASSTH